MSDALRSTSETSYKSSIRGIKHIVEPTAMVFVSTERHSYNRDRGCVVVLTLERLHSLFCTQKVDAYTCLPFMLF